MTYSVSNQTPTLGYISWSGVSIVYDGTTYAVADGNSRFKYVYWAISSPAVLKASDAYPVLGPSDCIVFINNNGVATSVLDSALLDGGIIVPGTVTARAIAADAIRAEHISAEAIEAEHVSANAIEADHIRVDSIEARHITAEAVEADHMSANSVTAKSIAAGAVTVDKLEAHEIRGRSLTSGAVSTRGTILIENFQSGATVLRVKNASDFVGGTYGFIITTTGSSVRFGYTGVNTTSNILTGVTGPLPTVLAGAVVVPGVKTITLDYNSNELRVFAQAGTTEYKEVVRIGYSSNGSDYTFISAGTIETVANAAAFRSKNAVTLYVEADNQTAGAYPQPALYVFNNGGPGGRIFATSGWGLSVETWATDADGISGTSAGWNGVTGRTSNTTADAASIKALSMPGAIPLWVEQDFSSSLPTGQYAGQVTCWGEALWTYNPLSTLTGAFMWERIQTSGPRHYFTSPAAYLNASPDYIYFEDNNAAAYPNTYCFNRDGPATDDSGNASIKCFDAWIAGSLRGVAGSGLQIICDGFDDYYVSIWGGSALSAANGAQITAYGVSNGTYPGWIRLLKATGSSGEIELNCPLNFPSTQVPSSDPNSFDDYREASYTATATGMTTAPTGTVEFVRTGNSITMNLPTISGTSNSTSFTLTGGPTTMRPSTARRVPCRITDNGGAVTWGLARIETTGVITIFKDANGAVFTNVGTKSIGDCSFSYPL